MKNIGLWFFTETLAADLNSFVFVSFCFASLLVPAVLRSSEDPDRPMQLSFLLIKTCPFYMFLITSR